LMLEAGVSHDVLIAEGALSETFVDDDSRDMFQNAHEFGELYPEDRRKPAFYYAPRVEDGYAFERVRRRLASRAGLSVPAATEYGALVGEITHCDHSIIIGWARNQAFPDAPVCLDVYVDGAFVGYAYAADDDARGRQAFALCFPEALEASAAHEIEVRRSADGAPLAGAVRLEPFGMVA